MRNRTPVKNPIYRWNEWNEWMKWMNEMKWNEINLKKLSLII
jgi:hypothetical protein